MIGPFHRRALRRRYYDGVIDATYISSPDCGMTMGPRYAARLDEAQRQGWFDAKAGRVLRDYEFSADELLRRIEVRESQRSASSRKDHGG